MRPRKNVPGVVYLIHFNEAYKHANHYIGWTENLVERLERHKSGNGARLIRVITDAGITFRCVRIWEGETKAFERSLKKLHGAKRICPVCNPKMLDHLFDGGKNISD